MTGRSRILDHSRQQYRDDQRRFSGSLGVFAGLVVLYLVAHHVWPADEPGRVVWTGPVGVALEWVWWAGIGAAVGTLTTTAPSSYGPTEASRSPASRWLSLLIAISTALLAAILFVIGVSVRVDASAAIAIFDFDRLSSEAMVPVAFALGFFHRLAVPCLQQVARSAWETLKRTAVSLPGWWRGFWEDIRAMWRRRFVP